MINKQLQPTCGHKTFGFQWLFEHPSTLQLMVSGDKNAARSHKRFIPQNRCATRSPPITNINAYEDLNAIGESLVELPEPKPKK